MELVPESWVWLATRAVFPFICVQWCLFETLACSLSVPWCAGHLFLLLPLLVLFLLPVRRLLCFSALSSTSLGLRHFYMVTYMVLLIKSVWPVAVALLVFLIFVCRSTLSLSYLVCHWNLSHFPSKSLWIHSSPPLFIPSTTTPFQGFRTFTGDL